MLNRIKHTLLKVKSRLQENSLDSLVWLVNIVPSRAGFSILQDKISAPFWILHLSLLLYVYGVGSAVFQAKYAQGAGDFIKSYVNISILALTANNSYWFLKKRPLLRTVLTMVKQSDVLSRETVILREKHEKSMSVIKKILFIFYGFNLMDAMFIYLPHRTDITNNNFSMTPCVGLEPLSSTPNHQICVAILATQELTIMTVVLNYQALLLFFIAHTAVMYDIMSVEIQMFEDKDNLPNLDNMVKERLPILIKRHALILDIINNFKYLYSVPLGVNFGSNAVCISFFFFLPLQEWVPFIPILIYCFLVFFLYCFLCQRLINAAEEFERAVYSCGWENFKTKDQKTVYVMLMQAQKPIVLLAADIIPVNIYTFATTLQAMYKFITVVKV
ncbi:uncharacterized protein [Epargyreus clarus]|uniref:uncharacterized protein n=1 Tax=Epargyreus clarus TaxID=520877 RepID=UPI003C2E6991